MLIIYFLSALGLLYEFKSYVSLHTPDEVTMNI
jgi:hypothetical protein